MHGEVKAMKEIKEALRDINAKGYILSHMDNEGSVKIEIEGNYFDTLTLFSYLTAGLVKELGNVKDITKAFEAGRDYWNDKADV